MVPSKMGDWRPCCDYRAFNKIILPDRCPVPPIRYFSESLHGATVFTKIGLLRVHDQIAFELKNAPNTAILTQFGMYEYLHVPFGVRNAVQTFQRFMDQALRVM